MMWRVPSVAIGTVQPQASAEPMTWSLLAALVRSGLSVQGFTSSAIPASRGAIQRITGRPLRHLDGWLQNHQQSLAAWHRGASDARAAVLYGAFGVGNDDSASAGSLELLTQRLGLPRIAIVDASRLDGCRIPFAPPQVAGILLDRVSDSRSRIAWQTVLEGLWDAPVLGWLEESLPARRMADLLAPEQAPSPELVEQLAEAFSLSLRCEAICQIAHRCPGWPTPSSDDFAATNRRSAVRVAVAYDEAFPCYAADTLELLEAGGACVRDFSPLRCEQLPEGTDLVLIGTGTADRFWPELARNCCFQQSLRSFGSRGGRVYAEGTGLVYLSRQVVLPGTGRIPMAGLIPVEARRTSAAGYVPVQITTVQSSWLFSSRQELRGYRELGWEVIPTGPLLTFSPERQSQLDVVARRNVIGSQVVMHFASQSALLQRFLSPFAPARVVASAAR
jgi:cobyrinic acid a,c-diamide synthase